MKVFGIDIKLEVEYIDLDTKMVGVICSTNKGSEGKVVRFALPIPQKVFDAIPPVTEKRDSHEAA